jgi:hypothetical protein
MLKIPCSDLETILSHPLAVVVVVVVVVVVGG